MAVTPLTEMLGVYRRLHESGQRGLQANVKLVEDLASSPEDLGSRFLLSVAQFTRYANPRQFFHKGKIGDGDALASPGDPLAAALAPVAIPPPEEIQRTVHFASWAKATGVGRLEADPALAFRYVDRELDCMRTSPEQALEDGSKSKRALVLDLLLEDADDGTPILAELKIGDDEDALYALIQVLAAAAHLVTASQRARLSNVYGLASALRTGGPYVDLYVIFYEPPVKEGGEWINVLRHSLELRDGLLQQASIAMLIRRIEFLHATLAEDGLRFARADTLTLPHPARPPGEHAREPMTPPGHPARPG